MNNVMITPTDNGPYLVQGSVTLLDAEGTQYEVDDTIALCRCGLSSTKPFCDGVPRRRTSRQSTARHRFASRAASGGRGQMRPHARAQTRAALPARAYCR